MKTIKAKSISYGEKRDYKTVKFIVVHYTGGNGDTAKNNGLYFKNVNKIKAGAHIFIGQDGETIKSIPLNRIAWAVGGAKYPGTKGGGFHKFATNSNSVSIELCDNAKKDPSKKQIAAVKDAIKYIRKYCPNARTVIRHYDVTGKNCPARMVEFEKWKRFKDAIGE